jgi:hypothetical protein
MRLPSRRSFAEARIALGSFDRFSRLADRLGKHRKTLTVLLAMAAAIAFGYGLSAGFAIFLLVSVAHASALAPIVPIADAMTLAAATGRFQYGWVRGAASAAFVVGAVDAGQVVEATSLGGIAWMNGTILALAAVAALRLPRNAPDRPVVQRQANVRALFAVPGFLPLMALAALVLSSHTLHEGFEVLRWEEGGIGPGTAGSATNSCQSDNRMSVSPGIQPCTELQTRAGTWRYDANKTGQVSSPAERFATGIRNGIRVPILAGRNAIRPEPE